MKQVSSRIFLLLNIVIFVSIFLFARAVISISAILIILMYLFNRGFSVEIFKRHKSLVFLFIAGLLINIGMIYVCIATNTFDAKGIFGFSNPLLILLYVCSIYYFLSENEKYKGYLINAFVTCVSLLASFGVIVFTYKVSQGEGFIYTDIYYYFFGYSGRDIQSIVALTFPLTGVILVAKSIVSKSVRNKLFMLFLATLVIFADIFINRSKVGYVIELVVFIYYVCALCAYYKNSSKNTSIRHMLMIIVAGLLFVGLLFGFAYKQSSVFNTRIDKMFNETSLFFSGPDDEKNIEELSHSSTGLRLMYYNSTVKVFKTYPELFLVGCPYMTSSSNPQACTAALINSDFKLKNDPNVVKDGIMPHNEFMNYTYKGGAIAGICLFLFFMFLIYEAKFLDKDSKLFLRIFMVAYFIGCSFSYLMTLQMPVILAFSLISIFLPQAKAKT